MASIELTVAYPGREGAHSAAACDRLFPAARLVPLPTFSDVIDAVVVGTRAVRRPPDRELARRAGRRDARPALRVAALDRGRGDPPDQPLPRRPGAHRARGGARDPLAPGGARSVPEADRVAPGRARRRRADDGRRGHDRGEAGRSDDRRDRERSGGEDQRPDDHRRQRRRPSRGVHALRLGRALHAARPARRQLADGVLLHDRSPPGSALPRARAALPARDRPQPARLAADPLEAVQLPVRRRPQRPPARPRDLRHAAGDAGSDGRAPRVRLVPGRPRGRDRARTV